jgi:hypothetical protein
MQIQSRARTLPRIAIQPQTNCPTGEPRFRVCVSVGRDRTLLILDKQTFESIAVHRIGLREFSLVVPTYFTLSVEGVQAAALDPRTIRLGRFHLDHVVLTCRHSGAEVRIGSYGRRVFVIASRRFSIIRVKPVREDAHGAAHSR